MFLLTILQLYLFSMATPLVNPLKIDWQCRVGVRHIAGNRDERNFLEFCRLNFLVIELYFFGEYYGYEMLLIVNNNNNN